MKVISITINLLTTTKEHQAEKKKIKLIEIIKIILKENMQVFKENQTHAQTS